MRRLATCLALAFALCAASIAHADDTSPDRLFPYSKQVMGTVINLTLLADDETAAAKAADAVFKEFERIDRLMSSWLDDSAVSMVNAKAGVEAVTVDPEVLMLILRSQQAARETGGAFDITVGAYQGLWKFDEDRDGTIPEASAVKERLAVVGYRDLQVQPRKRTVMLKRKGMRITLGGVAKGYAVDRAVKILHDLGFVDFIMQAGGDLYASGKKGSRKWRVGIRDPRGNRDATFALMEIENATFSTSGDYERSVVLDGVRYHHILDPKTGQPAQGCRSVTVLAKDALTADIWSTALFVLGPSKGMKLVERRKDLEAVFVDSENNVHVSSGLKGKLNILKPPSPGI